jgi:hypothetical protein
MDIRDCQGVLFGVHRHSKGVLHATSRRPLLRSGHSCTQVIRCQNCAFRHFCTNMTRWHYCALGHSCTNVTRAAPYFILAQRWSESLLRNKCVPTTASLPVFVQQCSNNGASCPIVAQQWPHHADCLPQQEKTRQTDMDEPIRRASITLVHEECLIMQMTCTVNLFHSKQ